MIAVLPDPLGLRRKGQCQAAKRREAPAIPSAAQNPSAIVHPWTGFTRHAEVPHTRPDEHILGRKRSLKPNRAACRRSEII